MEVDAEIACEIVRNIGQLWLDGQLIDLQIYIGDTVFNCSRLILCACSTFFQVLLKSEVKGEVEHPVRHVTLRGISPEIFQLVLNALYKGENGLDPDNMIDFWRAAHHLQIPVLVSKCETFVSRHLTQENFVNIHWNALCLRSVNVTTAVQQFVAENFETFKELDILLQQPASFIEDIIGGDSITGQSQDHVVEFILKWVNYELCARETEHVCADSALKNVSTKTNEVTRDTEHVRADSAVENLSSQRNEVTRDTEHVRADSAVENLSSQRNEVTRDTEHVRADSAVENLSSQRNEVTRDTEHVFADSAVENLSSQRNEVTRDTEHVRADSAVENLSSQRNEVTRDTEHVRADSAVENLSSQRNEVTRDTEHVRADSAVENLSSQRNEVTRDTEHVFADSAVENLSSQRNEVTRDTEHVRADSAVENLSSQRNEVTRDTEHVFADSAVENLSSQRNEVTRDTEHVRADSAVENLSSQRNEVTRDTEHVFADSAVENLSTQTNEVTRNTNGSVEVFFEKPHVDFGDDCFINPLGQPSVRKQSLGKLLKLVRFNEVSKDIWESLVDNELVMCSKETRDIVIQAMKLVNSAPTVAASPDTEDTVVFVTIYNTSVIYAYSLDRGGIFKFYSTGNQIANMHAHHTKLLLRVHRQSKYYKDQFIIHIAEFPFSESIPPTFSVENDFVIVGDFCYTSRGNMCRRHIKYGDWYELFALPDNMSSPSLSVFKDSILYYNSKLDQWRTQKVYCFNTNYGKSWLVMTCDYQDCDFVTFTHENQLYILYSNGVFVNVTQSVLSPVEAYSLPKYSEMSKSRLLWDFQFKIYGAVVHRDNLIVFGDLSSILVSEIHECKIPGLKAIKFVHLYGLITKCHPLIIPKQQLTEQM